MCCYHPCSVRFRGVTRQIVCVGHAEVVVSHAMLSREFIAGFVDRCVSMLFDGFVDESDTLLRDTVWVCVCVCACVCVLHVLLPMLYACCV